MKTKLSALLDHDLDEQTSRIVLDSLCRDETLRKDWEAYCVIGDVLRNEAQGSAGFLARVMVEIDADLPGLISPSVACAAWSGQKAANQRRFWQILLPVAASVMGVFAVGLVANALYFQPGESLQLAAGHDVVAPLNQMADASVSPSSAVVPVTDREALNRQYVFVHQAAAGGGPIPGAVQYVRTVSDVRGEMR